MMANETLKYFVYALLSGTHSLMAQPIDVVKVVAQDQVRKIPLPGEFLPYLDVPIYAKINGFVRSVLVDRGSFVKQGQLLAAIVAPEFKAQRAEAAAKVRTSESHRAEAQAKLVGAKSTYERLKSASATPGVIAGNELIQAEQAVEAARAQVLATESSIQAAQEAELALKEIEDYLQVTAPFSGVITQRNIHPGALVGPAGAGSSVAMFQLQQTSRLRLVVSLPEVNVGGISKGAKVPFTVPAYPGETFVGVVARPANALDTKTRSMAVELDVLNPRGRLAPGMYPTVMWPIRNRGASLFVPSTSIVTTTERTFVIRVKQGKAEWVNVKRGAAVGDLVEVHSPGLQEGDTILKRGSDEIREGNRLDVRKPKS
ncbi:MAG TPA: efflux RND transporter periplasmic adaptor subunit [Bryobacteraceae bacterium]|nr:efflux RND transporter periplasmic adaptor subunit [Bryobacteraceae bacterium]